MTNNYGWNSFPRFQFNIQSFLGGGGGGLGGYRVGFGTSIVYLYDFVSGRLKGYTEISQLLLTI